MEAGFGHIMTEKSIADAFEKKYGKYTRVVRSHFFSESGKKPLIRFEKMLCNNVRMYNRMPFYGYISLSVMHLLGPQACSELIMNFIPHANKYATEYVDELKADMFLSTHWATAYYVANSDSKPINVSYVPDVEIIPLCCYPNDLTLVSANDVPARDPKSWIVEGSVDGRNYVTVAEGREVPQFERRFMSRSFFFRNDKAYSHYRVRFPESHGDASVQLAELQLSATGGANRCPVIFSPTGHSGKAAESIQNSIDGRKETKWNCIFKKDMAWQIKYPEAQAFNTLVLTSANDVPARDPKSWVLEGLGNDGKWILLLTVTDDAGFPERLAAREFPFRNDRKFQSYRIRFQANQGDTSFQIAEIKLEKR